MLDPCSIAPRCQPPATFARAWKLPDWTCWLCSVPWTAWICWLRRSPQRRLRQLFELDADYAEALWGLDQPAATFNRTAMVRDTLGALDRLPSAFAQFRKKLPPRAHPILAQLEGSLRMSLNPKEAYNMVPGRNPENV